MFNLDNRTAMVTGAGAGIGAAVAHALAQAGARVLVTDVDADKAAAVAQQIVDAGGRARGITLDVRDASSAQTAAAAAAELGGGAVNILVNNAGVIAPAMFKDLSAEKFALVLDTHLGGTFHCTQAALPYIPTDGTGRVINVTSAAGLTGTIGQANYGAAKAAIIGLTKSLAKELARDQITANAVAPLAATAMTSNVRNNEKFAAATLARIPMQRWAEPEEVAGAFVFFASPAASYITGQVLAVDGGTVI